MIVAFDFDGTLAPSFNLVNRCIIQVAKDNGIFLKESDLIPYYGPTEEGMINNILKSDNRANFKKYLQYYSEYHNIEDLFQVGSIGLLKAYKNYDKNSNVKFSTFAYKYVFGEIISYIKKDRNIIVGDEYMSIYKKYEKVKSLLISKYNREVSFSEICKFMEMDEQKLLSVIESVMFTKSIDGDSLINYELA